MSNRHTGAAGAGDASFDEAPSPGALTTKCSRCRRDIIAASVRKVIDFQDSRFVRVDVCNQCLSLARDQARGSRWVLILAGGLGLGTAISSAGLMGIDPLWILLITGALVLILFIIGIALRRAAGGESDRGN